MKKVFFAIGIFCAGLCSCSEDTLAEGSGKPAAPGDEVRFSAFQQEGEVHDTDHPDMRTHYGLYNLSQEEGKYSIFWDDGDRIAIYCPQALATKPEAVDKGREADYKIVLSPQDGQDEQTMQSGTLSKINPGDVGLQWGDGDGEKGTHDFFAFYPFTAKEGIISSTQLKLTLPTLQTPSFMRVISPEDGIEVTYPSSGEPVTGKVYIARPNMNSCFMYAHSQGNRVDNDPISLNFKPIVTTLEAIVKGPEAGPDSIEVSQVVFRSNESICGSFSLTIGDLGAAEDGAVETINDNTLSNNVTIPVYYNHATGETAGDGLEPVKLGPGDILVVRAFLLPKDITTDNNNAVTVHMVGAGSKTKILNQQTVKAKCINITELPKLIKMETNYWMTMLDENVYFSQLSIPGSHNAYNIARSGATIPNDDTSIGEYYQTKDVGQQLAAGVRAFSFQVGFGDKDFENAVSDDGWKAAQGTYPLYVQAGSTQLSTTLTEVLNKFATELTDLNNKYKTDYGNSPLTPKEFIVLNITYAQKAGGAANRQAEVQRWMKEVDETIDGMNNGMFTNDISANTTLGDLAGKIVIFVNYQGTDWPSKTITTTSGWPWQTTETWSYKYVPADSAQTYVVVKDTYDESGKEISDFSTQNDRDYNYLFYQPVYGSGVGSGIQLWRQNLERLDNENLNLTGDNVVKNLSGRQTLKKNMIASLFQRAINNNAEGINVGNWYINNIGAFCVVNDEKSYRGDYGAGGNTPKAANLMNYYTYQHLANSANNTAPCGVVLMNFVGETTVSGLPVYSQALQQIIIENNYRFPLKVRGTSSGN